MAQTALTRLLPQLKASDAPLLSNAQRAILRGALAQGSHARRGKSADCAFLRAILKAFEQIGDARCIPVVERLAHSAPQESIREVAQACLPYLQALADKEGSSQTLLRAASVLDTPSEALLRPASSTPEIKPQQLLRASKIYDDEQA